MKYEWSEECNRAFSQMKAMLVGVPVLTAPDFRKIFCKNLLILRMALLIFLQVGVGKLFIDSTLAISGASASDVGIY